MNVNRKLLVSFSVPFGDKEIVPLARLNRTNVSKVLALLNDKVRKEEFSTIIEVFEFWFNRENSEAANSIYDTIINSYKEKGFAQKDLVVLSLWSNLELMNQLLSIESSEDNSMSNSDFEINLFFHYLKINEKFVKKSDQVFQEINSQDYNHVWSYLARTYISNSINNFEISNTNVLHTFIANFYKGYLLLSFLEVDYNEVFQIFLKDYQVSNKEELLKSILPIAFHAQNGENDKSGLQILQVDNRQSNVFLDFLTANTANIIDVSKEDFLHLRANPLFRIEKDEYLIIDRGLAINRIFNSIFFDVLKIIKDRRCDIAKDFFSIYTYEFIEKNLSYTVLNKIFRKRGGKVFTGDEITHAFGVDTEPDYYVRNGKKVFLFEIKGSILTGEVKQSFSWKKIEKELKKKFHKASDGKKAIQQLVERIEILVSEKAKRGQYDPGIPDNFIVSPILLVTDHSLNTIGVNHVLNEWFEQEVNTSIILEPIKRRIKKLVVIHIDTLIVYSEYFKDNSGSFESFINSYIERIDAYRIDSMKNKAYRSESEQMKALEIRINDIMIPFSKHMEDKIGNPKLINEFLGFGENLFK